MKTSVLNSEELSIFEFGRGFGMDVHSAESIARTLADIQKVQGSAVIAGGMAVIHHGYRRYTHDIDILYANRDEADILKRLKKDFKVVLKAQSGWHHLEHRKTKVRLELIPEGGLTNFGFIPGPRTVGSDSGFISLLGLVWMKLVSGRAKDNADIIEIAKSGRLSEMKKLVNALPAELHERYLEQLAQAQRELDTDPNLHDFPRGDTPSAKEPPANYGKRKRSPGRVVKTTKR